MKNVFLETFPHYLEGSKDAVKITYEFFGGETYSYFISKETADNNLLSLKEHNSPSSLWEYLDQKYDMGEKWKKLRYIFRWKDGRVCWDFSKSVAED